MTPFMKSLPYSRKSKTSTSADASSRSNSATASAILWRSASSSVHSIFRIPSAAMLSAEGSCVLTLD